MKYLITLILLFPSLAFAVDDAMIIKIDGKTTGNSSRIQELEMEDIRIKERILQNESTKANETEVVERLTKKAEKVKVEEVEKVVLKKADKTAVDAELLKKAEKVKVEEVEKLVLKKADKTAVDAELSKKAEKTEVLANKEAIESIELIPGPQGSQGDPGPQGPQGDPGPQGTPGADTPDRTDDICELYQRLSDMSLIGDLTVPEYCGVVDEDGDGFSVEVDCDDADSSNFPGNLELCDGQDNNCDTVVDEGDVCAP